MLITLVVAVAENGVIGRGGGLPWHLSSDLKAIFQVENSFSANIVVTRDSDFKAEGAIVAPSFEAALAKAEQCARARGVDEVMVIGGAYIFAASLPIAGRIYKTEVQGRPEGDTFMPTVDWTRWKEISREALPRGQRDDFGATLVLLEKKARAAVSAAPSA